ncbi:MAG: orotate phosphoribosyltransferase [Clostridium sp.]|nr:orotate phosphoribosyltransferase [Prevotella sp.]MCM1429577.1 orotate phosphoribosyltransferase [Clostridium sp.]MCM1476016.1 orotate phosphoribosyltransferase [Muribaculaceae bacterium]
MNTPDRLLAERLLHISAIKLQPESPFIWASGWNSPIYTDNRRALSYPDVRNFIKIELCRKILENFPEVDAIAGVATGAIAIAAIAADCLDLPFVYVRSTPKDHGLENMIEGNLRPGSKVVVVEDLIGTGGSSLNVVEAIRNVGCDVIGMAALFNFEFPIAVKRFRDENINLVSLLTYTTMIEVASKIHYIAPDDIKTLTEWRKDPANWTPTHPDNL